MGFPNIWNSIPRPNLTHLATYICVYMCTCACMHAGECGRGRTHTYTYIHTHTRTLVWVHTHTRVYTYMCIYPTHSVTGSLWNTRPKNFRKSTRVRRIHLNAIKTHHFPDNTDQLLTTTRSETYFFSAAPCSFDLQTTVSCYNFNLDKDHYPRCNQN